MRGDLTEAAKMASERLMKWINNKTVKFQFVTPTSHDGYSKIQNTPTGSSLDNISFVFITAVIYLLLVKLSEQPRRQRKMGHPQGEGESKTNHAIRDAQVQKKVAAERMPVTIAHSDDTSNAPSIVQKVLDQQVAESTEEPPRKQTSKVNVTFDRLPQRRHTSLVHSREKTDNADRFHRRTQSSNIWNTSNISSRRVFKHSKTESSTDNASSSLSILPWLTAFEASGKGEKDCSAVLGSRQQINKLRSAAVEDLLRNNNMIFAMAKSTSTMTDLHHYNNDDKGGDNINPTFESEAGEYKEDHSNDSTCFVMGNAANLSDNDLAKKYMLDAKSKLLCGGVQQHSSNSELTCRQQSCCGKQQLISTVLEDFSSLLSCCELDSGSQLMLHQQIEGVEASAIK